MKINMLILLCASLALVALALRPEAHGGTHLEPFDSSTVTEDATADALTRLRGRYDSGMKALIDSRCQACHASQRELNFADFDHVKKNSRSMADAVSNGRMPIGLSLTAEERTTLAQFLTELAAVP